MLKTQKSSNKTSSGDIALNMRTLGSPKVGSRGDAGGFSRAYILRIPSVSWKATKWGAVI